MEQKCLLLCSAVLSHLAYTFINSIFVANTILSWLQSHAWVEETSHKLCARPFSSMYDVMVINGRQTVGSGSQDYSAVEYSLPSGVSVARPIIAFYSRFRNICIYIYIYMYVCLHVHCTRPCTPYASPITSVIVHLEHRLPLGAPL